MLPNETPRVLHAGNGTRGPFSLSVSGTPISFAEASHIRVTRFDTDGIGTLQVDGTHYQLSATSALPDLGDTLRTVPTATLTFKLAQPVLAVGEYVLIERVAPASQDLSLATGGGLSSSSLERTLDAVIRVVQQLQNQMARAAVANPLDANGVLEFPSEADRAGMVFTWDADGLPSYMDPADLEGDVGPQGPQGPAGVGDMLASNNLSDLASAVTARTNLGVYSTAQTDAAIDADIAAHVAAADPHTGYVLESAYTAADVLSKLLTVDGAASGLDADLLDGLSSATFAQLAAANTFTANQTIQATSQQGLTIFRGTNAVSAYGGLYFTLQDSAGVTTAYANVLGGIADNTDTSEDGAITLQLMKAGTLTSWLSVNAATAVATLSNITTLSTSTLIQGPAGSASFPTYAFSGDQDTGFYSSTANQVSLSLGGSLNWLFGFYIAAQTGGGFRAGDGTASAPAFSFNSDTNTGVYRIAADNLGFTVGGTLALDISTARVQVAAAIDLQRGASPTALTTESVGYLGFGALQTKTAAFTFALADAGKMHVLNSASSRIATIPTNASVAYPIGTAIPVRNLGAGTLVLTPDTGVTLYNDTGASGAITLDQHDAGVLWKQDTNVWYYEGTHA